MKGALIQTNIKDFLSGRGIKQKYVAEQLGISEAQLSRKLKGSTMMTVNELVEISNAVIATPNELLGIKK